MIEHASTVVPALQLAAAGRGRGRGGASVLVAVGLAGDGHFHDWRRLPDSVGLFACADGGCAWFAVCPGCLGSLDLALAARDGVLDMALYWCPAHQGGREGGSAYDG